MKGVWERLFADKSGHGLYFTNEFAVKEIDSCNGIVKAEIVIVPDTLLDNYGWEMYKGDVVYFLIDNAISFDDDYWLVDPKDVLAYILNGGEGHDEEKW